jgi:D-alanyl-lipoteichoic acid acyltransferase DltB (MBOAT superfamily)
VNIYTVSFFLFCAGVYFLYYKAPRKYQNLILLLASYLFYSLLSRHFVLILLAMTAANFFLGRIIHRSGRSRQWLAAGILFNFLMLFLFKASNFFIPHLIRLIKQIGISPQIEGLTIILPIGMSFYILQAVSYLVDISRRQISPSTDPVKFGLFLAYFPKLTAGPIENARKFLPQIQKPRRIEKSNLNKGMTLILIGLFRKLVIADTIITAAPPQLFSSLIQHPAAHVFFWVLLYGIGIYFDFSGYTNIARGVSRFFGIELSRNFLHPLFARNFSDFWGRWHISLSQWLREYIFFPLTRTLMRKKQNPAHYLVILLPPVITMLASGFWHGLGWNFIAWGFLMGIMLAGERFWTINKPYKAPDKKRHAGQIFSSLGMFFLLVAGFIIFVMDFPKGSILTEESIPGFTWAPPNFRLLLIIIPGIGLDFLHSRRKSERPISDLPFWTKSWLLALSIVLIVLFSQSRLAAPFIYQGF